MDANQNVDSTATSQWSWPDKLAELKAACATATPDGRFAAMSDAEFERVFAENYVPYFERFVRPRAQKERFPTVRDMVIVGVVAVLLFAIRIPFLFFVVLVAVVPGLIFWIARNTVTARERRRAEAKQKVEAALPGVFSVAPE